MNRSTLRHYISYSILFGAGMLVSFIGFAVHINATHISGTHINVNNVGSNHPNYGYHNADVYHYNNTGYHSDDVNVGDYHPGYGWVTPGVVINGSDQVNYISGCQTVQECDSDGNCINSQECN